MTEDVGELLSEFQEEPDVQGLGRLSQLCAAMAAQDEEVQQMEKALEEKKKALHQIRTGEIPDLMKELKLESIRLDNGAVISIKRKVSCKFIPEKRFDALDWLDEHGEGGMIRRSVAVDFEKGNEDTAKKAMNILVEFGFSPHMVKDVHHSTLGAWGRRMAESSQTVPADLFQFNIFDIAEVKHG